MTYELCLEYGTYPLIPVNAYAQERSAVPDFLAGNDQLLAKLETMNALFHELFLTIECQFHYIGHEFPDKRAKIRDLYEDIAQELTTSYPDQAIKVEAFIL